MLKKATLAIALLYALLLPVAVATGQDLRDHLKERYVKKILYLRHSLTSNSTEYDSEGNAITVGREGPWSLYGRIVVQKVAVEGNRLRVEGKRAVFKSDGRDCGKGCMPFTAGENVTVT